VTRQRLHKGDEIVTRAALFAPAAKGLIPAGTTGTVLSGGRWGAQVAFDLPDRHGNPTTRAAILPYADATVRLSCYGIHNFIATTADPTGPAACTECGLDRIDPVPS
jgi:hypothetical protein